MIKSQYYDCLCVCVSQQKEERERGTSSAPPASTLCFFLFSPPKWIQSGSFLCLTLFWITSLWPPSPTLTGFIKKILQHKTVCLVCSDSYSMMPSGGETSANVSVRKWCRLLLPRHIDCDCVWVIDDFNFLQYLTAPHCLNMVNDFSYSCL